MRIGALLFAIAILGACEKASGDSVAPDGEGAAAQADEVPDDAFEITITNRCPDPWRYYVAPAESGEAATAAESEIVPEDQYTILQPNSPMKQQLRPGDVVWLVNRNNESTATGFQTKEEGSGGRLEITPACDGVKRVRMAPPDAAPTAAPAE
jgi:hypothetical protein